MDRRKQAKFLKWLYLFLKVILICETSNQKHFLKKKKLIIFCANIFIALYYVSCTGSYLYALNQYRVNQALVFSTVVYLLNRWVLVIKFKSLKSVINQTMHLSKKLNSSSLSYPLFWYWVVLVLFILIHLPRFLFGFIGQYNLKMKLALYGYTVENKVTRATFALLHMTVVIILGALSFAFFLIYYPYVCFSVRNQIRSLQTCSFTNKKEYGYFLNSYLQIKAVIYYIDKEISFITFISFLYSAIGVYLGVNRILTSPKNRWLIGTVASWCNCFYGICGILIICLSASSVYDELKKIRNRIQFVLESKPVLTSVQKQLLLSFSSLPCLTLWYFVPIKRSLIVMSLGTIMTYSVLVENFQS